MGAIRLDDDQLAQLSAGLLEEQREVVAAAAATDRRLSARRLLRFVVTGKPDLIAGCRQATMRTNAAVAAAASADREVAALELASLRAQVPWLYSYARGWAQEDSGRDAHALFARAVEALTGFYFGAASADRLLLAETQLAWIAERSTARMVPLSRVMRERRSRASQRYRSLWDEWARGQAAAPTT